MFNFGRNKDIQTFKIKLNTEDSTKLLRLKGLFTYQKSSPVTDSDVVSVILNTVESQISEKERALIEGKNKKNGKFIMMVGIPCSGKTYYARQLAADDPDVVIVSEHDIMREMVMNSEAKPEIIMDLMCLKAIEIIQGGKTVAFDSCNMEPFTRKKILKFISPYACEKICVVMNRPAEECERTNLRRKNPIDAQTMELYEEKRTFYPSYSEGWDEVKVIGSDAVGRMTEQVLSASADTKWDLLNDRSVAEATAEKNNPIINLESIPMDSPKVPIPIKPSSPDGVKLVDESNDPLSDLEDFPKFVFPSKESS